MPAIPRFGIVDMGSNAVRMMVAEGHAGTVAILESHRLPLRLGRAVFDTGIVPETAVSALIDAFRRFRATCERMHVKHMRAIATSAMREARNREQVIDRIDQETGIRIEVISGTHEAYLLARAIQDRVDLRQGRSVLVDVGGGSVEVVLVEDGQVLSADSYRLGALRLLMLQSQSGDDEDEPEPFLELLERHLAGLDRRIADRIASARVDRYLCVGGNIDSLADLIAGDRKHDGVDVRSLKDLRRKVSELAELPVDERARQHNLKPDRADTIVPAGVVYARIGEIAGVEDVYVPRVGIKDGLLVELAAGHLQSFTPEAHRELLLAACRALGRRFHYEAEHAENVLQLSRQLFEQTRELHGCDDHALVLLEAAALLHDIGVSVNNDGHHKHAQYLIQASEIIGLGDEDKQLVALIARYHRKAPPSRDHLEFSRLRRPERTLVERLASLLRIADSLDRQHASIVKSVAVQIDKGTLRLRATLGDAGSRLTLERRALQDKGHLFEQLLGYQVSLELAAD